jgi:hypothetical protein
METLEELPTYLRRDMPRMPYVINKCKELAEDPDDIKGKKIYLSCPFSHEDKIMQELRFLSVNWMAGQLIKKGYIVFSPISHSHPIAYLFKEGENDYDVWLKQDLEYIKWCDEFFIYMIDGWNKSFGVKWEIQKANELRKPIWGVNNDLQIFSVKIIS